MTEKTRYSDEELAEFKELILSKLAVAREEYETMMGTLMNTDNNGVDDTSPTYKALEEGANTQTKEELSRQEEVDRTKGILQGDLFHLHRKSAR